MNASSGNCFVHVQLAIVRPVHSIFHRVGNDILAQLGLLRCMFRHVPVLLQHLGEIIPLRLKLIHYLLKTGDLTTIVNWRCWNLLLFSPFVCAKRSMITGAGSMSQNMCSGTFTEKHKRRNTCFQISCALDNEP